MLHHGAPDGLISERIRYQSAARLTESGVVLLGSRCVDHWQAGIVVQFAG